MKNANFHPKIQLNTSKFYPVIFAYGSYSKGEEWNERRIINSQKPFDTKEEALDHAANANYGGSFEAGYAMFDGSAWISILPQTLTQEELHYLADQRLYAEQLGW